MMVSRGWLYNFRVARLTTENPLLGEAIPGRSPLLLQDFIGWIAAGLVFATFCAKRMTLLRVLAIASNIAFITYAAIAHLWPIVMLHAVMLPLNLQRLSIALNEKSTMLPAPTSFSEQ